MLIEIVNNFIKMTVDNNGNMRSIIDRTNNEELLYQPEEKSWQRNDLVVFPFTGKLVDGYYLYQGQKYYMENHGFARFHEYEIIEKKDDAVVLSLKYNEETLKMYPFKFELLVSFRLVDDQVEVKYTVNNLDDKMMYFGIGGHPAFKVDAVYNENGTDISGNFISFDHEIDKVQYLLEETGSFIKEVKEGGKIITFETTKELIDKYKIFMLKANDIDELYLNRKNGRKITFIFNHKLNYLAFWTSAKYGGYFCIEPWMTLQDFIDEEKDIIKKKTILSLDVDKSYTFSYLIKVR